MNSKDGTRFPYISCFEEPIHGRVRKLIVAHPASGCWHQTETIFLNPVASDGLRQSKHTRRVEELVTLEFPRGNLQTYLSHFAYQD